MATVTATPVAQMGPGAAYVALGDGSALPLDARMLEVVLEALGLAEGAEMIGTGEMARILGVSPKTAGRILDSGELPSVRYGARGRRMARRQDVLEYRTRCAERGARALEDMREAASVSGLDDADLASYLAGLR